MSKRATIYFAESTHKALRLKAAETDQSISDLVNDAVVQSLAEDAEDLATFRERSAEPSLAFEEFVLDLKRRGQL
ncbi:MAG TPA: CopG family transcriptional regulator [Candidatus Limnocylindria bacterium]|nr:CopG family transcriptional regulator [Candidatus Limnocylindria bacterium]